MVKWPFQRLSDLQLGDKKVTLNHLVHPPNPKMKSEDIIHVLLLRLSSSNSDSLCFFQALVSYLCHGSITNIYGPTWKIQRLFNEEWNQSPTQKRFLHPFWDINYKVWFGHYDFFDRFPSPSLGRQPKTEVQQPKNTGDLGSRYLLSTGLHIYLCTGLPVCLSIDLSMYHSFYSGEILNTNTWDMVTIIYIQN